MADEPALPSLPAVSWDSHSRSFANTRKRSHDRAIALCNNSSDPAVFSSDDDPHVENYANGRHRKKRYIGSWFQQQPASSDSTFSDGRLPPPKAKRTFERQVDSGVWMGSDSSVDFDGDSVVELSQPAEPRLPQLRHGRTQRVSPAEEIVRRKIQAAMDDGNESIDLSSLGIESVSNSTIAQLSEFMCIPLVAEGVPFEQKDPELKIFLSTNPLRRVPAALLRLEFLTVLSLRNTPISELPPSIGDLKNLRTLNLSLTRLRFLPAELLNLLRYPGKLDSWSVHPNPFYRPSQLPLLPGKEEVLCGVRRQSCITLHESKQPDGSLLRLWVEEGPQSRDRAEYPQISDSFYIGWQARIYARSLVQYSDSRGMILSKFRLPGRECSEPSSPGSDMGTDQSIQTEGLAVLPTPPSSARDELGPKTTQSRVPSLFELALQSCSRTAQPRELPSYLPPQTPPHFESVLRRIAEQGEKNANSGDLPCSICGRRVIVPTAEWMEWWDIGRLPAPSQLDAKTSNAENAIPFLKRGCSWKCVPQAMKTGQFLDGTVRSSLTLP
ncbi:hypothetical protein GGR56DRAFT_448967 [Xylariaceae sp. FL0804]|nr:hypothetical protein GGR56DRAFT_448967 [Xylariaceae sp. FL0804]